jgi:hypothetical protein
LDNEKNQLAVARIACKDEAVKNTFRMLQGMICTVTEKRSDYLLSTVISLAYFLFRPLLKSKNMHTTSTAFDPVQHKNTTGNCGNQQPMPGTAILLYPTNGPVQAAGECCK